MDSDLNTWVLLFLMPQLWCSVPVESAQLGSLDVLEAAEITGGGF